MYYNEHVLCLPRLDWTKYNTLTSLAFENHLRKALSCHLMESSEESAYIINIQ